MHVNYLSHDKAISLFRTRYFILFLGSFCRFLADVARASDFTRCPFAQVSLIWHPKSKVNPIPCKFAIFCSVNNLSNLPGYFSAFDRTSLP